MTDTIYEKDNIRITLYVSADGKTKSLTVEKKDNGYSSGWVEVDGLSLDYWERG